ncbi:MAG: hypothetical protein ACXABY_20200 [Candidatus Thorarchaeota archaeon]|jgi:peptidoglycan/xylan/chitin deacetylase (PgdA/CDA1 family)
MIAVRDDDVLLSSSSYENELGRFKQIHEWICEVPEHMIHVPTILVTEIQDFPEAIEYIRSETQAGRLLPQLHGLEHIAYGKLPYDEVIHHLEQGKEWMVRNLDVMPTVWYTPWGASQDFLHTAAENCGLALRDCSRISKLKGRYGVVQFLKDGASTDDLDAHLNKYSDGEIFTHWWEGGARLKRVVEVIKHNSWVTASQNNEALFR